jgi:hypothetical protein
MVIVLTILFGVGGLFVLSGLCMVTSHVVSPLIGMQERSEWTQGDL